MLRVLRGRPGDVPPTILFGEVDERLAQRVARRFLQAGIDIFRTEDLTTYARTFFSIHINLRGAPSL